jgi:hypothetical protein
VSPKRIVEVNFVAAPSDPLDKFTGPVKHMNTKRTPLIGLVGLLVASHVAAQDYAPKAILIKDAPPCSAWIVNRGSDELRAWGNANWLLGYLAAMTTKSQRKLLQNVPAETLVLWMDRYCKGDVLHRNIDDGANELLRELTAKSAN